MKTLFNTISFIVIIVVALFVSGAASAQNKEKTMSSNDAAVVASLGNIHAGCYEVHLVADKDGYLAEKDVEIHTGLNIEVYGGFAGLFGTSDNWSDQSDNSVSFGGALTYNHHKRNWPVDLKLRLYAEANTEVKIEEQRTKAFAAGAQLLIGFNPCGGIRPYLGAGMGYINSTSKTDIDNESLEAHIPFKSNAFAPEVDARVEIDLFAIKTTKNDRGIKVVKKRPVSLVINGKYQWRYDIDEPLGSTLKANRWQVTAGFAIPLFF